MLAFLPVSLAVDNTSPSIYIYWLPTVVFLVRNRVNYNALCWPLQLPTALYEIIYWTSTVNYHKCYRPLVCLYNTLYMPYQSPTS